MLLRRGVHALRRIGEVQTLAQGRGWLGGCTHAFHAGVGLEARAPASTLRSFLGMKQPRKILTLGEPVLRKVCRALTAEEMRSSSAWPNWGSTRC
jgi:hypothetical protein